MSAVLSYSIKTVDTLALGPSGGPESSPTCFAHAPLALLAFGNDSDLSLFVQVS